MARRRQQDEPSPEEGYDQQKRLARRATEDTLRLKILAALRVQHADLVRQGVMKTALPTLHSQMSVADLTSAQHQLNTIGGDVAKRAAPTGTVSPTTSRTPVLSSLPEPELLKNGAVKLSLGETPLTQEKSAIAGLPDPAATAPPMLKADPNAGTVAYGKRVLQLRGETLQSQAEELRAQAEVVNAAADAKRGGPEKPGHYDTTGKFLGEARYDKSGHLVDIPRESVRFVGTPAGGEQPKPATSVAPSTIANANAPTKSPNMDLGPLTSLALPQPGPVSGFIKPKPETGFQPVLDRFAQVGQQINPGTIKFPEPTFPGEPLAYSSVANAEAAKRAKTQPPAPTLERLPTPSKPAPENSEPKYATPPLLKRNDEESRNRDLAFAGF